MPPFLHIILLILTTIGAFFFMEFVAWFTHKYVMHGFLWVWHRSHHRPHKHWWERNDLFAVVFSTPAAISIYFGLEYGYDFLVAIGAGITLYGLFYVGFHDILVHQRVKFRYRTRNKYLLRMIRAHKVHHKKQSKEGCESFSFLIVPKKYEPK